MKKSIVALGMVLALSGCAAAADETLAAEPAALVEISPATEETAQPVEAAATAEPAQTATPEPTPEPTQAPTPAPTAEPTAVPTAEPTQAPVEETVAATPAQVSTSYGAVPFDLAPGQGIQGGRVGENFEAGIAKALDVVHDFFVSCRKVTRIAKSYIGLTAISQSHKLMRTTATNRTRISLNWAKI